MKARLANRLDTVHCGDRTNDLTDVARQINRAAARRIEALIDGALAVGARAIVRVRCDDPQTVGPCLLAGVPPDPRLVCEKAIERVRSLGPAINTSIFTDSLSAIRTRDTRTDTGATIVNDSIDFRVDHMPFGGNGAAGIGRKGVRSAMDAIWRSSPSSTRRETDGWHEPNG